MIIHNVEQLSPEWHKLREKRMTASHAQAISANGKGLKTYIRELMCGYYSNAEKVSYSNAAIENGIEQEPIAATIYEMEKDCVTSEVGFVEYDEFIGCSPDRFVGDDGLIEIKCPTDKVYFNLLLDKKIDSKYYAQMQMQMFICKRKWCDYVVYNPNFDQQIYIERVYLNNMFIAKLIVGLASGKKMIQEIIEKLGDKE